MSGSRGDFLIGKIALREGLLSRDQLYDSLLAQERNPSKSLGAILVSRGYLKNEDMNRLLDLQKRAFEAADEDAPAVRRNALFGQLLVDRGIASEYRVNECLRLQGRMAEMGMTPVPQLGEILLRRGYIEQAALDAAVHLQGAPTLETSPNPGVALSDEARVAAADPTKCFGKYVLVKEIGRGGAGIVYKAWQQDLHKAVALKILPHESDTAAGVKTPFGDVEDVKRFYNETRAHADLSHPNIVPILDFGIVDDHFYYTMQYIEGITLDGVVREGIDERVFQTTFIGEGDGAGERRETARIVRGKGMPLRAALTMMRDLALAVDCAHQRGVHHRDIKPGNIIIDKAAKPWLMDFGLAKIMRIGDSAYVKGIIMGTPYYMPPEQALGDMEQVDNLSDIYSLGAVLYEMVSGYSPFSGKSQDEVLAALLKEPPAPILSHVPSLAPDLVLLIEKAMAREKTNRYASCKALADDIDHFIAGRPLNEEPLGARPRSVWQRLKGLFGGEESTPAR